MNKDFKKVKMKQINTYLLETKWKLLDLNQDVNAKIQWRLYKVGIAVYFYFKGEISSPFILDDKKNHKEFIRVLHRKFPSYSTYLHTDRFWNNDGAYKEVTDAMRWREIYKAVTQKKLPLLYEAWKNPPVQLSLF